MFKTVMFKALKVNRSWLVAGGFAVLLIVYLLSADITSLSGDSLSSKTKTSSDDISNTSRSENTTPPITTVLVRQFVQNTIPRTLTLYGRTTPDRTVTLSAELAARVVQVSAKRGALLSKGDNIVSLDKGYLPEQLAHAKARLKKTTLDFESARSLQSKNLIAENQLPQLEVALAEARSQLSRLEIEWANTQIKMPINGILNSRFVELGDFIESGKPVAEILDLDPLIVMVDVPQNAIEHFSPGDNAYVRFLDGKKVGSKIRYISSQANASTRTFTVELVINNPGMSRPAGLSVEADLLLQTAIAIKITPALLTLNRQGEAGLKWVDESNTVHFTAVDIVKTDSLYIWLSGIPEQARIITRGQGFVRVGEVVSVEAIEPELFANKRSLQTSNLPDQDHSR